LHTGEAPSRETATRYIVDLSTIEQMLMTVIADGKYKPDSFKRFHIEHVIN
jgi:hypothetical protein